MQLLQVRDEVGRDDRGLLDSGAGASEARPVRVAEQETEGGVPPSTFPPFPTSHGAMADACQQQLQTDEAAALAFEERFDLLVDAEWTAREQRKRSGRLRAAKLRHPATLEAVDFTHPRRLNRQQVLTLGAWAWIAERHNFAADRPNRHREELSLVRVRRTGLSPRLHRPLRSEAAAAARPRLGRGDATYARLLTRLAKLDLLAVDDWMIAPLRDAERRDLTEVIKDRAERAATLIASQLPVANWHAVIGDAN